jgi:hypothetical protein
MLKKHETFARLSETHQAIAADTTLIRQQGWFTN